MCELYKTDFCNEISAMNLYSSEQKREWKVLENRAVYLYGGSNEQEEASFLEKTEKVLLKDDAQNSTFEIVV